MAISFLIVKYKIENIDITPIDNTNCSSTLWAGILFSWRTLGEKAWVQPLPWFQIRARCR